MGGITLNLRLMVQQYEAQLLAARRLARYRRARRLAEGEEEPRIDPQVRRRAMVERVARELYEMILFTGSDNPVVDKIRERMTPIMGAKVRFTYPPGDDKLALMREDGDATRPLSDEEKERAMQALWHLTLRAVDESML